jgi:hypothetical protein
MIENESGENAAQKLLDSLGIDIQDLSDQERRQVMNGVIPNSFMDAKRQVDAGNQIPDNEVSQLINKHLPTVDMPENLATNLRFKVLRQLGLLRDEKK